MTAKFKKGDVCRVVCPESAYHASVVEILKDSGWVAPMDSKEQRCYDCRVVFSAVPWASGIVIVRESQLEIIHEQESN